MTGAFSPSHPAPERGPRSRHESNPPPRGSRGSPDLICRAISCAVQGPRKRCVTYRDCPWPPAPWSTRPGWATSGCSAWQRRGYGNTPTSFAGAPAASTSCPGVWRPGVKRSRQPGGLQTSRRRKSGSEQAERRLPNPLDKHRRPRRAIIAWLGRVGEPWRPSSLTQDRSLLLLHGPTAQLLCHSTRRDFRRFVSPV